MTDSREELGRLVREVWVEWARKQPDPKSSWLASWEELGDGQREADMRIGETVAGVARATEREQALMPSSGGVYVWPSAYDASVFPEHLRDSPRSALDAGTWKITVEARGFGKWAVMRGRACLGSDGTWDWEPRPSSREDEWLETHRLIAT